MKLKVKDLKVGSRLFFGKHGARWATKAPIPWLKVDDSCYYITEDVIDCLARSFGIQKWLNSGARYDPNDLKATGFWPTFPIVSARAWRRISVSRMYTISSVMTDGSSSRRRLCEPRKLRISRGMRTRAATPHIGVRTTSSRRRMGPRSTASSERTGVNPSRTTPRRWECARAAS